MSNRIIIRDQQKRMNVLIVFDSKSFETLNEFVHVFIVFFEFFHEVEKTQINETQIIHFLSKIVFRETIDFITTIIFLKTKKQKYMKFKTIETTTFKQNEFFRFRVKIQFNWKTSFSTKIVFDKEFFFSIVEVLFEQIKRSKKYKNIKISIFYQNKIIFELKEFFRTCLLMYEIRFATYEIAKNQIRYVKTNMSQINSKFNWFWTRHKHHFDLIKKSSSTWKNLVNYLKKTINSIKQRVNKINERFLTLKQRENQTMIQFIAYLKNLENQ